MKKQNDNFKKFNLPEFYESVINNITDALIIIEHSSEKIVFVNDVFLKAFNYSEEEVLNLTFKELHPRDFLDFATKEFDSNAKAERNFREVPCVKKNGDIFKCNIRDNTFVYDNQTFSLALFSIVAIDSDEALKYTERVSKIKLWMQQISTGVVYHNTEGGIISANKAAENILGLTLEQMQGRSSMDKRWHAIKENGLPFPGEDHPAMMALATGKNIENVKMGVYNPATYNYNWIKISALLDYDENDKNPIGVYAFFEDISEQEKYLQNLLITNDLFAKGPVVIFKWSIGSDYPVEFVSRNVEEILGYQPNEFYISDVKYRDLIHPDNSFITDAEVKEALKEKQDFVMHSPYQLRRKDGTYITINDHTRIIYNSKGEVVNYIGYIYDISEMKEYEEKLKLLLQDFEWQNWELKTTQDNLQESEERWKFALEGSKSGVWDWNLGNDHVYYSPRWKKMLGYDEDEISTSLTEWDRLIHPDDRGSAYLDINAHIYGKTDYYENEHRVKCKSGEYIWVLDRGKVVERDENKKALRMIGTHTDITDRKKHEEFKDSLAAIIENSSDIIIVKDLDLRVIATNQAFAKVAGKQSIEQLIGKTDAEIFDTSPDTEPIKSYMEDDWKAQKLKKGEFLEREEPVYDADGAVRYVITRKFPVYDKLNKLIGTANISTDITRRKEIEAQLIENEKILNLAMESTNSAIWHLDIQSGMFTFSGEKIWREILGYDYEDFEEIDFNLWHSLVHPLETDNVLMQFQFTVYGDADAMYDEEYRMKHKSGKWIWVNVRGKVNVRDVHDNPLLMQGIILDISDRKKIENKLRSSEENFRTFFETMENMIFVMNKDGNIIYTNNAVRNKLKYTANEILKMNIIDLRSSYNNEEAMDAFKEILEGTRSQCTLPFETKDGGLVPVESKVWFGKWNNQDVVFCVSKDITELQAALEKFNKLFDNNPALMAVTLMPNRFFTEVNDSFVNTLGYSREELIGKTALEVGLFHDKMQLLKLNNELEKYYKVSNLKLTIKAKDGKLIYGLLSGEIFELNGEEYFLSVMIDTTELRETEIALQESDEKYRVMFEDSSDAYLIIKDGTIIACNDAASEILATGKENIIGKSPSDLSPAYQQEGISSMDAAEEKLQQTFNSGRTKFEWLHKRFDGTEVWVEVYLNIVNIKGENMIFATWRDINDRKNAEEALKKSEEKYRQIADNMGDMVWTTDMNLNTTYVSPSVEKLYGASSEEYLNKRIDEVFPVSSIKKMHKIIQEELDKENDLSITKNRNRIIELMQYRADKSLMHVSMNIKFIRDEHQIPIGMQGVTRDITQLKMVEERVELLAKMTDIAPNSIMLHDAKGKILYANMRASEMHGYSYEEFLKLHISDIDMPEDHKLFQKRIKDIETKGEAVFEVRHYRKDGTIFPLEVYVKKIDWNGQEVMLSVSTDISERKKAEEELLSVQEQYRLAVQGSNDGIWDWDIKSNYLFLSEKWKEMIGYQDYELDNSFETFKKLLHPEDKEHVFKAIDKYFNSNDKIYEVEFRFRHKQGHYLWILARGEALRMENGKPYRMAGSHSDITMRKTAEESLKRYAEMHKLLTNIASKYINMPLNEVHDSIQKSLEEMGKFVNADRAYLFDYDWENQVTNNTYEWCEDEISPQIEELQGIPLEMMTEWLESHTKGETMYIPSVQELPEGDTVREILEPQEVKSLIAVPMMYGNVCLGFAGFDSVRKYHNYTENELKILNLFAQMLVNIRMRTQGEVALIEAKREAESANKAKSEFLANISHEIRTPMNAILGFSEVMLNTVQSNQQRSYLKTILNSGKTLLSLINDILDLSKIEAGRLQISPEPIDIQVVLHEIGQIFAQKIEEKGLDFIVDIDGNFPPSITIDEVRFRQILLNIVGNAIKFTDYGYIKLKLKVLNQDSGIIDFSIDVEDSGIGINKEDQARIFESFSQKSGQDSKKYGGTGLGLAISRRLCELMNGTISLESEEGRGSVFTISFNDVKFSDDVVEHKDEFSWDEEEIIFENLKILIVDDVPSNRGLVLSYLNNYNLTFYEAENGRVAVESTLAFKPDFVFMDIRMPGMTGFEATEIIKANENTKDIPIVALTASTMRSETESILKLFDGYLRKPIQKKSLINEMCRHLPFQKIEKAPEKKNIGEIQDIFNNMTFEEASIIKSTLKNDFLEKIDDLLLMMNIDEITEFSNKLIIFANNENSEILQSFNEKLTQAIAGFEFEEIEQMLESLKNIENE